MHNDQFLYEEDNEEVPMPPLYGDKDFDSNPSEDKFMMCVQGRESTMDHPKDELLSKGRTKCVGGGWALALRENFKGEFYNGCYDKMFEEDLVLGRFQFCPDCAKDQGVFFATSLIS